MKKVLLVSMPYGALERPALGLSLLKPALAAAGIPCDVRYLNFTFADLLGLERYRWISGELPYTAFAGDWTFTHLLYGERPAAENRYLDEILRRTWCRSEADIRSVLDVCSLATYFLEHLVAAVPWREYAVVGFTSTFEQNIASLAMARKVKHLSPETAIVFGGANWEGEMGLELHRRFRFVDYVCSGESEISFPMLVEQIFRRGPVADIPGIVYRAEGQSVSTGPPDMIREMDQLPVPDFADYFRDLERSGAASGVVPTLLFETSRGCWWGAKHHCTFCGLNGQSMAFRSKSAPRALAELEYLLDTWGVELVEAVDNILDMKYFRDLLPALAAKNRSAQIFYEVKANLTRKQVELLRDAGVNRIQPGIESMSDHVLKLMRKGTTALQNIQLLKWCKEYNILADWNVLYGFPGETRDDYQNILNLLPAIKFLGAPVAWGPVRMDRFSPYFNSPSEFGMRNLRSMSPYRHLYPFREESLSNIAYYFDYDYDPTIDPTGCAEEVVKYLEEWKRNPEMGSLCYDISTDGALLLLDSRSDATVRELALCGLERAAYEYCDQQQSLSAVVRYLRGAFPEADFGETQVRGFLDSLVANRLMVTDGTQYLALAVAANPGSAMPPVLQSPELVMLGA
jgi:ribosomal peptide maturation radical SAM protein 1